MSPPAMAAILATLLSILHETVACAQTDAPPFAGRLAVRPLFGTSIPVGDFGRALNRSSFLGADVKYNVGRPLALGVAVWKTGYRGSGPFARSTHDVWRYVVSPTAYVAHATVSGHLVKPYWHLQCGGARMGFTGIARDRITKPYLAAGTGVEVFVTGSTAADPSAQFGTIVSSSNTNSAIAICFGYHCYLNTPRSGRAPAGR